jgi:hypothetical protein
VLASEVLWIGDSWVQSPGTQRDYVRDQARLAQTLGMTEDYDSVAVAAAYMDDVSQQYADREITNPLKVILMDGGTWDPIAAQTLGASVDDAMDSSIARFQQFLADVAADGSVEHIVYFLPPPLPLIPSEQMQPRLLDACAQSEVPCHFLDLKDVWENHPEYTQMSIQASPAGGTEIGKRIWEIMQTECIAQ